MARKELFYTVESDDRDNGKMFYIQEMSASNAEWWALRAMLAIGKSGVEIPENMRSMGMAALATHGLKLVVAVSPDEARPLLDELMACVQFVPNPENKSIRRELIENDIEEVVTRLKIRAEVFKLHVDFFSAASN